MQFILIRTGTTDFDSPARIMGRLDIPLNSAGREQVRGAIAALMDVTTRDGQLIDEVYSCPAQAAEETARMVSEAFEAKVRCLQLLENLDHGLWQGQLVEEIRRRQPRVFRRWLADPESICPPEGETPAEARGRVERAVRRIRRRSRGQTVAIVCPDPLAGIFRDVITGQPTAVSLISDGALPLWEVLNEGTAPDHSELFEQEAASVVQAR